MGRHLGNRSFWLPSLMFLLFLASFLIALQTGPHKYTSLSRALSQWDGQHYISIARDGYRKYICDKNSGLVCGNVGWFPNYALAGRLLSLLGFSVNWSLIVLSWLSLWLFLLVLYKIVETAFNAKVAGYTILATLLFPCSFYYATAFPYSFYLLLGTLVCRLLQTERYTPIFLLTGILATTYPSGSLIVIPIIYRLVSWRGRLSDIDKLKLVAAVMAPVLSLMVYFYYYYVTFNDFFLYITFQSQYVYAHKLTLPWVTLYKALTILPARHVEYITILFAVFVLTASYSRRLPLGWRLFMFGVFLFTLTFGTTQCYYRHIVVAAPLFVGLGLAVEHQWRRYLFFAYAVVALFMNWSIFLPAFKQGRLM